MEAIRIVQTIQKRGEIIIQNMPVEEGQVVEVVVLIPTPQIPKKSRMTARMLLSSDLIGIWKDRQDIPDSLTYARQLREQAQKRPHIGGVNDDNSGQ